MPYRENGELRLDRLQDYLVLEKFTRQLDLPKFAERAATKDTPKLRKHLREHVFLVKEKPDKGRWEPKAQSVERIVFMTAVIGAQRLRSGW